MSDKPAGLLPQCRAVLYFIGQTPVDERHGQHNESCMGKNSENGG